MKKAATVALLCFVIGFLSLQIGLSIRDYKREMSKAKPFPAIQPKPTSPWTFGEPPQTRGDWREFFTDPKAAVPALKAPARKKAQPEIPAEPPCMMSDQRCAQRTLLKT